MSTGGTTNRKPQLVDLQLVGVLFLHKNPFMGSGTTGRVCDKLGRSFVGYDLKDFYLND